MERENLFYDDLETRPPQVRRDSLLLALQVQIDHAKRASPGWRRRLADIDGKEVQSLEDLAGLPVLRKADLISMQAQSPPFADLVTAPREHLKRLFASPGPIYEPQGSAIDPWRLARALHAAGFQRNDLIHNCFAYHFTPAGNMFESGAHTLGCAVFPGGVGQTGLQLRAMQDLGADGYGGTPSFLLILLQKAREEGLLLPRLKKALVAGEPFPPAMRAGIADCGVAAQQCYATAECGLISYETTDADGNLCQGMVMDEQVVIEIVEPGGSAQVVPGETGEVVVTNFASEYPLIRFATGDLSRVLPGPSPCGRTHDRLAGWLGRADQSCKVRGLFVHPAQIMDIKSRHPSIKALCLVIERGQDGRDLMRLLLKAGRDRPDSQTLIDDMRGLLKLRGEVEYVDSEALPKDGRLIDDRRRHD